MEVAQSAEESAPKKGRHRKKQLYNSILNQMEFYFGDSNLSKDRFLSQLIQTDPFVDISTFLKFNKIRKLTSNVTDIAKATSKSQLLELSEDKTKVRRTTPVQVKEDVDACTIYVERLKSDATHEWLTSIFSEFGNVAYVSIPRYKHNDNIKGFAFVEFETPEQANTALQYFESIDCKIPPHIEPQKLCSIATYEGNEKSLPPKKEVEKLIEADDDNKKKRKRNSVDESENKKPKCEADTEGECESTQTIVKMKRTDNNGENVEKKKKKRKVEEKENGIAVEKNGEDSELTKEESEVREEMEDGQKQQDDDMEGEEKKKKKHKKSHRKKVNLKEIGFQILSKKDWKKMRNRYLDMQKKTMKQLKMHLYREKFMNCNDAVKKPPLNQTMETQEDKTKPEQLQFTPGIIVKVAFTEPCEDTKKLKAEIKSHSSEIKYVDIPQLVESKEVFIRFSDNKYAQEFCASNPVKGKSSILEGAEEQQYWEKIETARQNKQKRSVTKQRGRDKLLKKAEKQVSKHVRFDDSD